MAAEVYDITLLALNFSEQFVLYSADLSMGEAMLTDGIYDPEKFLLLRDKMRKLEIGNTLELTMEDVITFYIVLDFSCKFFLSGAGDSYREHFLQTKLGNEENFEDIRTNFIRQATFIMRDLETNYADVNEQFRLTMDELTKYEVE